MGQLEIARPNRLWDCGALRWSGFRRFEEAVDVIPQAVGGAQAEAIVSVGGVDQGAGGENQKLGRAGKEQSVGIEGS